MRIILYIACISIVYIFPHSIYAQEIIVITPFTVNAPSEYSYLATALPGIIASRLSSHDIIAQQEPSHKKHGTISGTLTILGKSCAIDITLDYYNGDV